MHSLLLLACVAQSPSAHAFDDLAAGDIAYWAVPAASLGVSFAKGDEAGAWQFAKTWVATSLAVELTKRAFNHTSWGTRPNGGPNSFPSGHVASVCSAAAFLHERYDVSYGAPAYALAGLTAYSRVDHDKHHWRDVIAGCAVGIGFAELFTTRLGDTRLSLTPDVARGFVGIRGSLSW